MEKEIIDYIIYEFHGGDQELEIGSEEDLLGAGLVESIGMMRLIQFLENQFKVKVHPRDMTIENFMTVGAMVRYIERTKS